MSDFQLQINDDDPAMIDRLVDGELSEAERHELLLSFDREPVGWRRCALAFLESQSWKTELSGFASRQPVETDRAQSVALDRRGQWNRTLGQFLSLAAVALITVGLTLLVSDRFAAPRLGIAPTESLAHEDQPSIVHPRSDAPEIPRTGMPATAEALRLVVDETSDAPPRTLMVPLVESHPFGDDLAAAAEAPPIPEAVRRLLERMGHRIENHRRYAPVELEDGSKYLLPVDDVHIYPVSRDMQ